MERIRELRELLGNEDMVLELIKTELHGGLRPLRRRAPHEDRAVRGRHRHRGPDRRPADGHLDHELGLHQVAAAGDLPRPAPRRRRDHRHGHEGRGLHRAPLRVLDARLPAVLHEPRQGLPVEGLRPAGDEPAVQGALPRQRAAAARGRAGAVGAGDARLLGGAVPRLRDPQRHGQEDGASRPTTRRSRPTASSPSTSATTTSWSPCAGSTRTTRS